MSAIINKSVSMEKAEEQPKFIFIASRDFTNEEKHLLEQFGKVIEYNHTFQILLIDEIFQEKNAEFLYFNVNTQDNRKYLSSHYNELKKYKIVFLKKENEKYDESWILQFKVEDPIIIKHILPAVRKIELITFLTTFHKVHAPTPWYTKLSNWIFH